MDGRRFLFKLMQGIYRLFIMNINFIVRILTCILKFNIVQIVI